MWRYMLKESMRILILLVAIYSNSLYSNTDVDNFLSKLKPECQDDLKEVKSLIGDDYAWHMNYVLLEVITDLIDIRRKIINAGSLEGQKHIDGIIGVRLTVLFKHPPFTEEQIRGLKKIKNELSTFPLVNDDYNNTDIINMLSKFGA
jgi:hypothetical protein